MYVSLHAVPLPVWQYNSELQAGPEKEHQALKAVVLVAKLCNYIS